MQLEQVTLLSATELSRNPPSHSHLLQNKSELLPSWTRPMHCGRSDIKRSRNSTGCCNRYSWSYLARVENIHSVNFPTFASSSQKERHPLHLRLKFFRPKGTFHFSRFTTS